MASTSDSGTARLLSVQADTTRIAANDSAQRDKASERKLMENPSKYR
jgi:hypothetical protein